jgi:hypothetical protein
MCRHEVADWDAWAGSRGPRNVSVSR